MATKSLCARFVVIYFYTTQLVNQPTSQPSKQPHVLYVFDLPADWLTVGCLPSLLACLTAYLLDNYSCFLVDITDLYFNYFIYMQLHKINLKYIFKLHQTAKEKKIKNTPTIKTIKKNGQGNVCYMYVHTYVNIKYFTTKFKQIIISTTQHFPKQQCMS